MFNPVSLSQELIKFKSYSGKNEDIMNFLENILVGLGFNCEKVEFSGNGSYAVDNLHAIYNPKNSSKTIYFAGHTDIVSEGDVKNWSYDPYSGIIADGKLYGRGAVDMKSAIACFISAVGEYLEKNKNIDHGIGFLITNDEEADSINGTEKMLKWMDERNYKISCCIVGEPTNPSKLGEMIKIGRRGSINFKVQITGKQGHVAYPENALNPNTILINLLKILKDHKFDNGNENFDPTNLEITHIDSDNFGNNVIPKKASANFNVRFNNNHKSSDIISIVEYVCNKSIFNATLDLTYKAGSESFLSQPKGLADLAKSAVKKICKIESIYSTTGGTSDARFIKNSADEVIEFGAINKTAHQIDENINLEDIYNLQKIYFDILNNFYRI